MTSESEPTGGPSLYRRVLGDRYQQLHPLLQEFHDRPEGKAEGVFRIIRPKQLIKRPLIEEMLGYEGEIYPCVGST